MAGLRPAHGSIGAALRVTRDTRDTLHLTRGAGVQARAQARLGPRAKGSGARQESIRNYALRAPILPRCPHDPPTVLPSSPERRQGSPWGVVALRRPPSSCTPGTCSSSVVSLSRRGQGRQRQGQGQRHSEGRAESADVRRTVGASWEDVGRIGRRSEELLRISGKSLLISATGCGIVGIISKSDRQPMLRRPQPPQSIETQRVLRPNAGAGASLRRVASYAQLHAQPLQHQMRQRSPQGCCKCRVGDSFGANARVTATSAAASPNRVCDSAPNASALRQLPKGRCRADHENVTCAGRRAVLFYTGSAGRGLVEMEQQRWTLSKSSTTSFRR